MIVNRWPNEFVYASRRILGDILSQHEASRNNPFRLSNLKGGFAWFGAEAERRPVESNEIYSLIRRATEYISDYVGTLDDPELAPYVLAKIHLFSRRVRLWGVWEEKYHHEIATFTANERLPGIGPVFLALVGSGSNFIGRPRGLQTGALRTPSDAYGLYDIVNECLEAAEDPTLRSDAVRREQDRLGSENERWFENVARVVLAESTSIMPMELVDVLFKPHRVLYDSDLGHWSRDSEADPYAVAVIGTPLWIAKSRVDDNLVLPSGLRRYQADTAPSVLGWQLPAITQTPQSTPAEDPSHRERPESGDRRDQSPVRIPLNPLPIGANRTWQSFDANLEDVLRTKYDAKRVTIGSPPVGDQEWQDFCHWFVDQAVRFGDSPASLRIGRYWASHNGEEQMHSSDYGWIVEFNDPRHLIVLTDGRCLLAKESEVWSQTKYRVTRLKSGLRESAFRTLFLVVREWWLGPEDSYTEKV